MKKRTVKMAPLAAMAMLVIILLGIMAFTAMGGDLYKGLNDSRVENAQARASLSYVMTKIKGADETGAISIGAGPEGDMLILEEPSLGTRYETRIYLVDGALMEEYAMTGSEVNGSSAVKVAETDTFTLEAGENTITVTTDEGTGLVALHSKGAIK